MVGRLDRMGERLDRQDVPMGQAEDRIYQMEDTTTKITKGLEVLETLLRTVVIKNEDLDARSRHNNIRILGRSGDYKHRTDGPLCKTFAYRTVRPLQLYIYIWCGASPQVPHGASSSRCILHPLITRLLNFMDHNTSL
ncbi:hypothetical protein NDU88_006256 [Pleurodeles waltl]|uniref:Uncharacterized protein n=1 Tax=Pleurodeles waltl TaxID=8319 RepID=A0AAV7LWF4_PLEWA|nr:hypothetical protein NDU88_006256 [Pleurodeles waltl]